jgi:hypothetical protein
MGSGRRIPSLDQLLQLPLAIKSNLTRAEIISVVLYTGPMVPVPLSPHSSYSLKHPCCPFFLIQNAVSNIQLHSPPISCRHIRVFLLARKHFFHDHICTCVCDPKAFSLCTHYPRNSAIPRSRRQTRFA